MSTFNIIAMVLMTLAMIVNACNIALSMLYSSKPKLKVNPEKECKQNVNQPVELASISLHTAHHLMQILDEISVAAVEYREWFLEVIMSKPYPMVADYKRGFELQRKLKTLMKKYDLLMEENK